MSEELKALSEYPDVNFIDGYTCEKLTEDMIAWFRKKKKELTGVDVTLPASDDNRILLMTGAYYIFHGMMQIDNAAKMGLLKYSTGSYLDNLGAYKRVSRKKASAAKTKIRFEMDEARESATAIRPGIRLTAGDGVYFATDEYTEIPAGEMSVEVSAACMAAGKAGNIYSAGEINKMVDNVVFVDRAYNVTVADGGTDRQEDDDYREDIYAAPDSYAGAGSEAAYKYYVHRYNSSISEVRINSPTPRTVEIMCLLDGGTLMSDEFISGLQQYMDQDDIRMLTDTVIVKNPEVSTYNLEMTYYINASDKNRAGTIQKQVAAAVDTWVEWQRSIMGRDINPDELIKLVKMAGAKRCVITNPEFTVISDGSIAVMEAMKIVYGGLEDD